MDQEFLIRKLRNVDNNALKQIWKLRQPGNEVIMDLVRREAMTRALELDSIPPTTTKPAKRESSSTDEPDWLFQLAMFLNEL